MTTFTYTPKGVCSKKYVFEMEGTKIISLEVTGGCSGNLKGISRIVRDMEADQVIKAFRGTQCGPRPTSCPDQIACALEAYKASLNQ